MSLRRKFSSLSADSQDSTVEDEKDNHSSSKKKKSTFALNYMNALGYEAGKGLGRNKDGRLEPVEASKQKGTRGLGYKSEALEAAVSTYDPQTESIEINESITWLHNRNENSLSRETLKSWVKSGQNLKTLGDFTLFCDSEVMKNIFSSKQLLSHIGEKDLLAGRRRSNPFELISKGIFLNRAAMKMANMDAILDWMFTKPQNLNKENVLKDEDLLYFADVCAGPGGFSEYVFYKKKWRAKGFGFTLRGQNDFKLDDFLAGPSETFHTFYGPKDDGDIYNPENISTFADYVMSQTEGKGVHFMMADGGIHIEKNFNEQELECKKLYLCQCLVALMIVRTDGHFVCKLFDLFSNFSVGLLYLMYRSFRSILILKPNTSRPANSERYLVCKFKRNDCDEIARHLFEINKKVPMYSDTLDFTDVLELVPISILKEDEDFFDYLYSSNMRIANNQINGLRKLAAFCENDKLVDDNQAKLKKICLQKWNIPDGARAESKKTDAESKWKELFNEYTPQSFESDLVPKHVSTLTKFYQELKSTFDWQAVLIGNKSDKYTCGFYIGLGRQNVRQYISQKWKALPGIENFLLPAGTVVYGEIVEELIGEGKSQMKNFAFHIIDGLFLGGEDIRQRTYQERWELCKSFAEAVSDKQFVVRVKNKYNLIDMHLLLRDDLFCVKTNKNDTLSYYSALNSEQAFKIGGILFFTDLNDCWHRHMSKTHKCNYLFCTKTNNSIYETDVSDSVKREIYSGFVQTFKTRQLWRCELNIPVQSQNKNYHHLNELEEFTSFIHNQLL